MRSIDYLKGIDEEVLRHIDSREPVMGLSWLNHDLDPLEFLAMNVERKAHAIRYINSDVPPNVRQAALDDASLDMLGYAYLLRARVRREANEDTNSSS